MNHTSGNIDELLIRILDDTATRADVRMFAEWIRAEENRKYFEKYKKIAAIVVFVIFLLIFIWKRYKIVLFLTIISLITAVLYNLPNSTGIVKPDSFVYILPTKNSTIFFKVDKEEKVEVLQTKNGFIKVLGVDNGFIGWIKEESFETN